MKVKDLIDYSNSYCGDITAVRVNDSQGRITFEGIAGSTEDFLEEGFLPKGKYILLRAIDTVEINDKTTWKSINNGEWTMQLTDNEREILQDLVFIEYNNDTTDLIEYRNKLSRIHFKLTEEE